jgi:electron-transferring-flavoprotein dehydrogenase
MKSGMLAADATFKAISSANAAAAEAEESDSPEAVAPVDISEYQTLFDNSWIAKELFEIRNVRPSFHSKLKNWGGMIYSGFETLIFRGRTPWTFHHPKEDWAATEKARCVELSSSSSFFYPPF